MDKTLLNKYKKLRPTDKLGLFTWDYCKELKYAEGTSDFTFVALGDSFTWGEALDYKDTWPSQLSSKTGWGHINVAWNGSSIENMCRKLDKCLGINPYRLHICMLTYPWRSEKKNFFLGERRRRIKNTNLNDAQMFRKIEKTIYKYKSKPVVFTNVWGYPDTLKACVRNLSFAKSNFILNNIDYLDRAQDDAHAGPESHQALTEKLYIKLQELNYA